MSAPVSRLRDASFFSDEEGEVAVYSAYERFERSYVAKRKVVPRSGTHPTVKGLLPAGAEIAELPPPSTPPPRPSMQTLPSMEVPLPSTEAPRHSSARAPRPSRMEAPFEAGIAPHALLVFAALHVLPLLAWVLSGAEWTWRSASTFVTAAAALGLAAALRLRPSRRLAVVGLAVATVSFARIVGVEWTWSTWLAFLMTAALAAVLARAVVRPLLTRLFERGS
jgi:hypothetical protein